MHARFGAQPAVRVLAANVDRRALDARDLAGRFLEHVYRVALALGPLQVHAKQHRGPVLRLGAARAGLHVEEGIVRVHLAREHAAELEHLELFRQVLDLTDDIVERARVFFLARELVELAGLVERLLDAVQRPDDGFELGALSAQALRALGIRPDDGVLELAVDLFEPLALGFIVKDTSAARRSAL